jgi:uncharacterized phage-associated protein
MGYPPRYVANAFIQKAKKEGKVFTHLKLQKLVFFLHAWSLALHGKPAIDEHVEAWPYGPVVESLYHELKSFGSGGVNSYLREVDQKTGVAKAFVPNPDDAQFWGLFDQVWDRYARYSAGQLSDMTHKPGSPWAQARAAGDNDIPDKSILDYFKKMAADGKSVP